MAENRWDCVEEKSVLKSKFVELVARRCQSSEDRSREYTFYIFRSQEWANIIPVTEDGSVVLVRQYRLGSDRQSLEIPGGVVDHSDINIRDAAIRELAEETGYVPIQGARCIALGSPWANPAMQNNRCHAFIVGPVRRDRNQELDPGEMIEVVEIPIQELPNLVLRGEIDHALILNAFFYLMLRDESGTALLKRRLEEFARLESPSQL